MAIRMNITPTDVKATKIVKPQWYQMKIVEVKEELAKDKESTNVVIALIGQEGDANGVPFKSWISEKFPGGGIAFVRATGGRVTEDEGIDPNYDFKAQEGKTVLAKVTTSRGKDGTGKPMNSIEDFAPAKTSGVAEAVDATAFDAPA